MTTKNIPARRRFRGVWDEIDYLYHKILYWFYDREDRLRASRFCARLARLLAKADAGQLGIKGQECRSLIAEVHGDLQTAVRHRQNEIRSIRRLWAITKGKPGVDFPLQNYGPRELSDRLDLLAILYHDAGEFRRAIETLVASKELCTLHGISFDASDLLREYLDHVNEQTDATNGKRRSVR